LLLFLVAYWLYIDAVNTIIRMAADFGMAIGLDPNGLIIAILMVQFIGFPATLIFTYFTQRWDTKKAILLAIGIYIFIVIWASMIEEIYEFFILAGLIALVQGGIQSLSRSYYMRMIPQEHISEFFGFYNFLGKFASILGPLLLGVTVLITQNSRAGILSILIFLIIGGVLLLKVDEKKVAKEVRKALSTKSD
jgi:UMF1 family MFS transporter